MKKTLFTFAVVASMTTFGLTSCGSDEKTDEGMTMEQKDDMSDEDQMEDEMEEEGVMVGGAMMVPSKDIVDNAAGSEDHKTLVAAVKAAGLVETLKGKGPFTVFAPTDAAFTRLPGGAVENLMMPANKSKLSSVLTYHVVSGTYKASDLKDGQILKTVNGETIRITEKDGKWMVNGAWITIADVISSNGVTHVIDAVLMPKN